MRPEDSHLTDERIVEIQTGALAGSRLAGSTRAGELLPPEAAHLAVCEACSGQMAEVRRTLVALRLASRMPSDETVEKIVARGKRQAEEDRSQPSAMPNHGLTGKIRETVRELVATLIPQPFVPAAGVRGPGLESQMCQVFDTEEFTISFSVSESDLPGRVRLLASLTPKLADRLITGGTVTIIGRGALIQTSLTDGGEFEADDLEPGDLHVEIDLEGCRIQLSPVCAQHPAQGIRE